MKPAMLQHDSAFFACTELHITTLLLIIQTSFHRHIQKPNLTEHIAGAVEPESIREKYGLRRICTSHFTGPDVC